ncbi:MAG: GNAT family N-acetyltransferase [Bowdeniella nasicola]|nr:GNAT family N-acetyltransferase [Bowdeniella nasicola]
MAARIERLATGSDLLPALARLTRREPHASISVRYRAARLEAGLPDGGTLFVRRTEAGVDAALWLGSNVVPCGAHDALPEFARILATHGRRCTSILGPDHLVADLWRIVAPLWPRPREIRRHQPLLAATGECSVEPNPRVRIAEMGDADAVAASARRMYREEVGYDPRRFGLAYERHMRERVAQGRSYVITAGDRVGASAHFICEVGILVDDLVELHGVWVDPRLRGRGLASGAMAAVLADVRRRFAPHISLYVNADNDAALRLYERTGFTRVGQFATVIM